jgi:hypothetical protein
MGERPAVDWILVNTISGRVSRRDDAPSTAAGPRPGNVRAARSATGQNRRAVERRSMAHRANV